MKVIVITGSIATGKSTVSRYLEDKQLPLIDSDKLARVVVEKGTPGLKELVENFGEDILFDDGSLNRAKLGTIIFNDESQKKTLNNILHPLIFEEMLANIQQYEDVGKPLVFVDIPLYHESKNSLDVDQVWVVYIPRAKQIKRLMDRNNISEAEAENLIDNQMSIETKAKNADLIIDNSGELDNTFAQVDAALEKLK